MNHEQVVMRDAVDTVQSLKKAMFDEPHNEHARDKLINAVLHYKQLGYGFRLTRETTQIVRLK